VAHSINAVVVGCWK